MVRQRLPLVESGLDAAIDALDSLMAEVRLGFRDQRHFNDLEERADQVCKRVRGSFRETRDRSRRMRRSAEQ